MVATLLDRVDGLPVTLVDPQVIWPAPGNGRPGPLTPRRRAEVERRTAAVHECRLPASLRPLLEDQLAEAERLAVRADLARAGLL
jgi:hypothetical protein